MKKTLILMLAFIAWTTSLSKTKNMNSTLLKLTALLLILAGVASSCNPEEPDYPIGILFTEYSLESSSCQWRNLNYDDKIIIINSNEELENYISCSDGNYSEIDFSKHTLLLASGKINGHISEISAKDFKQLSSNKYKLYVEVTSCNLTHIASWSNAVVVDKLNNNCHVELNIACKKIEFELGLYKDVYNWLDSFIEFIDREKLAIISTGMNGETFINYYSYTIVKDSIQLTNNSGHIDTNYFHIIHSAKFELHVNNPPSPKPFILIYEKQ